MKLITQVMEKKMLANGQETLDKSAAYPEIVVDHMPVVKLFTPDAACTWLLSELDPSDHDRAFGLCDLGMGFPELGWVSLAELRNVRGQLGLPIERDLHFVPRKCLSLYVDDAYEHSAIIA